MDIKYISKWMINECSLRDYARAHTDMKVILDKFSLHVYQSGIKPYSCLVEATILTQLVVRFLLHTIVVYLERK